MSRTDIERFAVVGVSARRYCGVRDHGRLLGEQLRREGSLVTDLWLDLPPDASLREARAAVLDWSAELPGRIAASRAQAVVLHYSVFALSHRGLPLFARPVLSAVRSVGLPIVTVLHEVAYPWPARLDPRGIAWASTQRIAARGALRASTAVIVTADFRADWIRDARWLARRPLGVAPVFSNLPASDEDPRGAPRMLVGIFGWDVGDASAELVLSAAARLSGGLELRLLGAPGTGDAADRWLALARERGCEDVLSVSGALPSAQLADELGRCDALLYIDPSGPSGRKGTLAAMLAAARPLVALAGRRRWPAFEAAGAALCVQRDAGELADALAQLRRDARRRAELGAAARAFYDAQLAVEVTARTVRELLAG